MVDIAIANTYTQQPPIITKLSVFEVAIANTYTQSPPIVFLEFSKYKVEIQYFISGASGSAPIGNANVGVVFPKGLSRP